MAYENIDLETLQPNGKTGEPLPTALARVRRMFKELYASWTASSQALAKLTPAADKLPYFTGAEAAAVTDLSAFARTLLDDANGDAALATLGGAAGGIALLKAADAAAARAALGARALGNVALYLVNDTFTVPTGCKMLRVLVIGGGAGGSGALSGNAGGGGGGGGVAIKTIYNPTVGQGIAVTIGAGGAAGVKGQGDGGAGGNGGTSSFGSYCSATGGTSLGYGQAGNSGVGVGGDINLGTGPGGLGGVRGTDTTRYIGGNGGGFGGPNGIYSSNGQNATTRGCGGAGGGIGPESAPDGSTGTRNGGQGAPGLILVEWC